MDEAGDGDDDDGGQIEMMGAMGEDGNNDDERQGMGGITPRGLNRFRTFSEPQGPSLHNSGTEA